MTLLNVRTVSLISAAVLALLLPFCGCRAEGIKEYKVKVVKEYPHDVTSYTQGLFFQGGQLYESTGQYGSSTMRKVELETGKALRKLDFSRKYFIEGSVMLDGNLYILTWTNKVAFIYDAATLAYKQTYTYPREGWGLTTDGKSLITSDGTNAIWFLSKDFKLERRLNVTFNGKPVRYLNELEWIDGKIWANVYTTDVILIINPDDGKVEGRINCSGLLPAALRKPETDVLNGIAVLDGRIFLTGKNWPKLYEVKLENAR